jgi:hypothetical protein
MVDRSVARLVSYFVGFPTLKQLIQRMDIHPMRTVTSGEKLSEFNKPFTH